jgi:hypothetical protein
MLTKAQRGLLVDLKGRLGPVNVWSITDARAYREMETAKLVRIVKPVDVRHDGSGALPYFAVRIKAAGRAALQSQEKNNG